MSSARVNRCKVAEVDVTKLLQTVKIELHENDSSADIERHQQYGFSSHPDTDSDLYGLVITFAGQRFVIALDDPKYRPKDAEPGEVDVWHRNGDRIRLKNNNTVHVKTKHYQVDAEEDYTVNTKTYVVNATTSATFNTPLATFSQWISAAVDVLIGTLSLKTHKHREQGDGNLVGEPE